MLRFSKANLLILWTYPPPLCLDLPKPTYPLIPIIFFLRKSPLPLQPSGLLPLPSPISYKVLSGSFVAEGEGRPNQAIYYLSHDLEIIEQCALCTLYYQNVVYCKRKSQYFPNPSFIHFCMPSLLAPDPIRVQSCVCCLFWTNRNIVALTSIFLSFYLSIYLIIQLELWILESALLVNGNIYFYRHYSGNKLK